MRTVRREGLDRILIANGRHVRRGLAEYVDHHNRTGHTGLSNRGSPDSPLRASPRSDRPPRWVLGGLINEYRLVA